MNVDLKQIVEQRYSEYMDRVKEWDTDIPTGREGKCDLCTSTSKLTEHHLVPRRMFPQANESLMTFLEKLTIKICTKCHNKLHPENIWKEDLFKFKEIFENEVKTVEEKVKKELSEKNSEVAKAKQAVNNMNVRYTGRLKEVETKTAQIKDLKEKIKELRDQLLKEQQERRAKEATLKESKGFQDDAVIFFNLLQFYKDDEEYRKELREEIKTQLEKDKTRLLNKETASPRDIKFLIEKINMMPFFLGHYSEEQLKEGGKILQRIFHEEQCDAIEEVFEIEVSLEERDEKGKKKVIKGGDKK